MTFQISQGSASTYFRWSGQLRKVQFCWVFIPGRTILPIFLNWNLLILTDKKQNIT